MGSNPYGSLEPGTPDPIKPLFPEVSSTGAIVRRFGSGVLAAENGTRS